jgi:hypothetical protein
MNLKNRTLLCLFSVSLAVSLFAGAKAVAQTQTNTRILSPTIVASHQQMLSGTQLSNTQMDAPMSTYTVLGHRYWMTAQWRRIAGGITHSVHEGDFGRPYQTTLWTKETCNRNAQNYCVNGPGTVFTSIAASATDVVDLWIVSLYQPQPVDDGELLAFVHEERVGGTGGPNAAAEGDNAEGKTRIGLAWSADHGNTWTYLGRIISPRGDPKKHNIQGAPYVVKDGYFYIYFTDALTNASGQKTGELIATARAPVASVLAAARAGNTGNNLWQKYSSQNGDAFSTPSGGSFSSPGLGGSAGGNGLWGITHTQAAYSTYTQKYYLPLTFLSWPSNGQTINSSVKIYESDDAVNWNPSPKFVVADEPGATLRETGGYQYCSIVDTAGGVNATVGQRFYIYCMKDPIIEKKFGGQEPAESGAYGPKNFGIYRWEVNLGPAVDTYRQSVDYTSQENARWKYMWGTGAALEHMHWLNGYWQLPGTYAAIYSDSFHPGVSEMPALTWVAPKQGTVRIEGTLRSANPQITELAFPWCGDGVGFSVIHNSSPIFSTSVGPADTVGKSIESPSDQPITANVSAGDGIFFIIAPGANNYCDMMRLDPSITYITP